MTEIRPSDIDFERRGDELMIRFSALSGESALVVLSTRQLSALVARLVRENEAVLVPIDRESLGSGRPLVPHSYEVRRHVDGRRLLSLMVRLENRDVTIPFELSPLDAAALVRDLE